MGAPVSAPKDPAWPFALGAPFSSFEMSASRVSEAITLDFGTFDSAETFLMERENSPSWAPKKLGWPLVRTKGSAYDASYLRIMMLIRLIFFVSSGSASFFSLPR